MFSLACDGRCCRSRDCLLYSGYSVMSAVRSRKTAVKFDYDPGRYPRPVPSWDTTNAEYGRFDYRRRTPLVPGVSGSVYRRLEAPGARAQAVIDQELGGFNQRRSTYVDEISDVAIGNYTKTSQVHGI